MGCKSSCGMRRHMVVPKRVVGHADPDKPIEDIEFISHICLKPLKSETGLKWNLKGLGC